MTSLEAAPRLCFRLTPREPRSRRLPPWRLVLSPSSSCRSGPPPLPPTPGGLAGGERGGGCTPGSLYCSSAFRDMLARGAPPDHFTLPPVLRSCALTGSTALAASSLALSVKIGAHGNPFVGSALVLCYAGLSDLPGARRLFDGMRARDAVRWTSMLSAYAQGGLPEAALRFFEGMVAAGVQLDAVVMVSLLLACGQLGWRRHGRSVHACCVRRFLGVPLSLGNALVDMYVKCGEFAFAERVFTTVSGEGRKEEGTMFTARRKIQKVKGLVPVEFEDSIAQAFFDLEIDNQELKSVLKGLYIDSAFQMDVAGSKKAVVFRVPCRLRKAFRKIHVRLFRCIAVGLIRGSCPWICSVVALKRRIMVSTVADIAGYDSSWSSRVAMPWP